MSNLIFIFGVLLWFGLAYSVGYHARGHNRSGIVWFCVTAATGLFGVAFYLLAITSSESEQSKTSPQLDEKILKVLPLSIGGMVSGSVIGLGFVVLMYYTLPGVTRPEPFYWLIALSGLVGAGIGPKAYFKAKSRFL